MNGILAFFPYFAINGKTKKMFKKWRVVPVKCQNVSQVRETYSIPGYKYTFQIRIRPGKYFGILPGQSHYYDVYTKCLNELFFTNCYIVKFISPFC